MICCQCELHGLGWSQRTLDVVGFFSFLGLAEGNGTHARPQSAIENLVNIQQSLETKRTTARELREQLKQQEDVSEKQALEQKIERTNKDITSLQLAFENIALGNPDLSVLTDEPVEQIDWRVELERVSRPLLSTLKELTAKPRHIDSLRRESARLQDQLKVIQKAIDSIYHFKQQTLPPMAAAPIDQLLIDREQRKDDVEHALEITHFKLAVIKTESTAWYTSAGAALTLRQTLPRYAAELRLLLGVGPVREKERLVLDGVPFIVESLSVYTILEFKAAGASSLDYQIYIILNGRAAKACFRTQRMIQQACVDACNREGWVIPFTQVTVHSGNSAEGSGKQPDETASGVTQIATAPTQHPG